MKSINIFKHVTDGGATYLTDNHKFADADIIIRIDGGAELIRCNTDTKAFDEEPIDVLSRGEDDFEIHNCSKCNKVMTEGYVFGGGEKYFCSDKCLHTEVTQEEWEELSAGEDNDAYYWTVWEEEGEIGVELELEIDKLRENTPSTEIELFILFGLDAGILFDNREITEEVQNNIRRRVFATEGEKSAYIEGMKDNAGWGDYNIISKEEYIKITTTETT